MSALMPLRRLVLAAMAAGLVVGALVALLGGGSSRADVAAPATNASGPAGDLSRETGPLRTARPGVRSPTRGTKPVQRTFPVTPGRDARVVVTVPDPYGGPDWALRTFRRANVVASAGPRRVRRGTVECAQVGRMLRGRFVWIAPRATTARPVPVASTDNTVCGGQGRAAVVGALRIPAGRPGASQPTIAATVLWGLSRRKGTDVAVRTREGDVDLPDLGGGGRLVVRRGEHAIGAASVRADGRPVVRGLDNQPFFPGRGTVRDGMRTEGLRIDAVVADPSNDRPQLLVTAAAGRSRCYALTGSLVDGEPVRVVTRLGALAPSFLQCQPTFRVPADGWAQAGGFAGSSGQVPSAERRRARVRRALPGYSAAIIAVPPRVVSLDLTGPTGVRTVRTVPVGDVRLAVSLAGGDLPLAGFSSFQDRPRREYVGRDASGRTVRLRNRRPLYP